MHDFIPPQETKVDGSRYMKVMEERDKVTEMLIKLYQQVTSFNIAHPTLRVHIPHEIYKWYKEEIKGKEND